MTSRSTIIINANVWTGEADGFMSDAILFGDERILALGKEALEKMDGTTEVVDALGATVLPVFSDGHAHPTQAGLEPQFAPVRGLNSVKDIVATVKRYSEENPDLEWIQGWGYDPSIAPEGQFDAIWLDEAVSNRPVALRASDYHTVWCNSKALQIAGIDSATFDPAKGGIVRRQDGSPMGTLREWGATDLIFSKLPPLTTLQKVEALLWSADRYLASGVGFVQDAWVEPEDIDAYITLAKSNRLPLRFNLAFRADPERFEGQVTSFLEQKETVEAVGNPFLTANTVKLFVDGIIEAGTAAMIESYHDCPGCYGIPNWEADALSRAVSAFDAMGFQVHIHAIGDLGVRMAINAIEAAQIVNGPRDRRPTIAHAQLIDPEDIARFAKLGIIANFEPLWAQLDPLQVVLTIPRLGKVRGDKQYQIATLMRNGSHVSFGSDWPVSDHRPLAGISVAITRQTLSAYPSKGWVPNERITLDEAISAYCSGTAYQAYLDTDIGRLMPGMSADLILLDQNLKAISGLEIASARVKRTWIAGNLLYSE